MWNHFRLDMRSAFNETWGALLLWITVNSNTFSMEWVFLSYLPTIPSTFLFSWLH